MKEMKRSNNTIFKYTMILGAAMSLSACNGLFENIYDAPTETEMEIKENSFSQIKTVEYTEWAYIDFSGRKVTTVKIGKEYESEIPDNWDIAIHRYDIKTNEGAAYQTSYTSFDALKANGKLPDDKDFVKDEWTTDKIAIDMSGMMEGQCPIHLAECRYFDYATYLHNVQSGLPDTTERQHLCSHSFYQLYQCQRYKGIHRLRLPISI